MKFLSENFKDLHQLYINQLRMLLSAEEQIVRELPNMVVMAADEQLRNALQSHLLESETQIKRLEQILAAEKSRDRSIDSIGPLKCKAIAAMSEEVEDMMMDAKDAWVRDAALIAAAQRIEHYEIASYGAVRNFAQVLGESSAAEMLDRTIKEEGNADHQLSAIAQRINPHAQRAA